MTISPLPRKGDGDDFGLAKGILARAVDIGIAQTGPVQPVFDAIKTIVALAGVLAEAVKRDRVSRVFFVLSPRFSLQPLCCDLGQVRPLLVAILLIVPRLDGKALSGVAKAAHDLNGSIDVSGSEQRITVEETDGAVAMAGIPGGGDGSPEQSGSE